MIEVDWRINRETTGSADQENMETLESSRLCRLCGKYTPDQAFDIFDKKENHVHKINAILPITVDELDFLPKYICLLCSCKLTEFYQFYNQCLQADDELKSQLSWMPPRNSEGLRSTGGIPMVEIRNYKVKGDLEFDVNEIPLDKTKNEEKTGSSNHSVYTNDQLNLENNKISKELSNTKGMRCRRKRELPLDNPGEKNNSTDNLFVRKLRSNKTENSPSATTLCTIQVSNSKINTLIRDSKLLSDVEVKLEKMNVESAQLFKNSKDNIRILETCESKNYDENFDEWRPCKRKSTNI